jgi:hypothetical protein
VALEPWGSGDLPLLERLMGDARVTEHLGGPEGAFHDLQRLAPGPARLVRATTVAPEILGKPGGLRLATPYPRTARGRADPAMSGRRGERRG